MKATTPSFAPLLQRFFTQRLMQQRQASPHTISSYRDTFRFLLRFAQQRLHTPPARLALEVIDAPLIVAFLDHLEKHRDLSTRSRNLRPRVSEIKVTLRRLGRNRRFVLILEWLTLWPTSGFLPVRSQRHDMAQSSKIPARTRAEIGQSCG